MYVAVQMDGDGKGKRGVQERSGRTAASSGGSVLSGDNIGPI